MFQSLLLSKYFISLNFDMSDYDLYEINSFENYWYEIYCDENVKNIFPSLVLK